MMNKIEVSQTQKENMTLGETSDVLRVKDEDDNKRNMDYLMSDTMHNNLIEDLLNYLVNTKAIFKSQQKGEPELTTQEKRAIAEKLLKKSHCLFLAKFGHHLKEEHLKYFTKDEDYETVYHVNRLRRYFNNLTRHIDVRNRRYEALKSLIEKGEYFSECEMMKRNPLLYEHLVGQYLTEEEKKARDSIDTHNITNYVDVLMETVERDKLQKHLESQQKEEDNVREENDSDDDDNDDSRDTLTVKTDKSIVISATKDSNKQIHSQWGGILNVIDKNTRDKTLQSNKAHKISKDEIQLLRQEFLTNMYQSFLDGKDRDFDYSTVDDNEAYDSVELRGQDEEEKYFDSEPPETVLPHKECNDQSESEDELDAYMRTLKVK